MDIADRSEVILSINLLSRRLKIPLKLMTPLSLPVGGQLLWVSGASEYRFFIMRSPHNMPFPTVFIHKHDTGARGLTTHVRPQTLTNY